MAGRILLKLAATARPGEIIEIKALVEHPMESGYRTGPNGARLPRDIIGLFVCTYDGEEVFRARFSPALAANPFLSFFTVATRSGTIAFRWSGDNGFEATQSVAILVE